MQEKSHESTEEYNYESIRKDLEAFLPSVGAKIMELRRNAESDPDFSRLKADKTIVTKADELSEDLIRSWIQDRFPDDTIRGEERAEKEGGSRMWIIDPIDGTYNFNHFGERFGISVGLIENNDPKFGVIFYPAENISISASKGTGTFLNGIMFKTSKGAKSLSEALVLGQAHPFPDDERFKYANKKQLPLLAKVRNEDLDWSTVASFLKFLRGDTSAILHCGATPYDIGAVVPIAKELGLPVSGYDGEPIDFSKDTIPIVISKNALLHEEIIDTLNSDQ